MLAPLALLLALVPPLHAQTPAPKPAPPPANTQPPPASGPKTVLVFPVDNLRKTGGPDWLADWLQEAIAKSLLRSGALAVGSTETARQWQAQFATGPLGDLPRDAWDRMGVDAVVQASVQPVLQLVNVRLRVQSTRGDLLTGDAAALRIELANDDPGVVLEKLLLPLRKALALDAKASGIPAATQPETWKTIERAYTLLGAPLDPNDPQARPARAKALQPFAEDVALRGRIYEALARLTMEHAVLVERDADQMRDLGAALRYVDAALTAEPWDTDRRALRGEIHYFMKQDYEAKTDASVARLKNPANALAYAVLGLVAGASSGEGTDQLKRAQRLDPFLWAAARAGGQPPFQGGVLESALQPWAKRQAAAPTRKAAIAQQMSPALMEGIQLFHAKRWDEANAKLQQASTDDEYDFRPLLYQARILIETGHSPEAVQPLRELQSENPAEPEVQLWLGVALARTGALEDARPQLEAVLQDNPRQVLALYYLAMCDAADRRWGPVSDSLRMVVAQEPRNESAWYNLGVAQANLEQWKTADEAFAKVLAINPKSQPAQEWRARVRSHLN